MTNVVVIPYCGADVERLGWIANLIASYPPPQVPFVFLLVRNAITVESDALKARFGQIGEVLCHVVPRGHRGDSTGIAEMFWSAMEFIHQGGVKLDGGFALWWESDMLPVKPDWLDRLDQQWRSLNEPLVMGQHVDALPPHLGGDCLPPHVHAAACYSSSICSYVPSPVGRREPFDSSMFPYLSEHPERWHASSQFTFTNVEQIEACRLSADVSVVRGLGQPSDDFVRSAIENLAPRLQLPGRICYDGPAINEVKRNNYDSCSFVDVFRSEFKPCLTDVFERHVTFEMLFAHLEELQKRDYLIVETGCVRHDEWKDGRATVLFDRFVQFHGGQLISVDCTPGHCRYANAHTSDQSTIVRGDSVQVLAQLSRQLDRKVDLLYLDSFDVSWDDVHPSALHHLMEFCAVRPLLQAGSVVVVDDHGFGPGGGKSAYVKKLLSATGDRLIFERYQIAWILS